MTKVTTPISFRKTARFAGNWLASLAESRSARRRLNTILRLASRTLGMKRRGGLGMLGIGGAVALLAVGLASPALAQYTAASPAIGQAEVPAGVFRLSNGFGYEENAINASSLAFTVAKGAVVTSSGVVKANGVVVPLNVPLDKDYFFPEYKGEFPKGTFFKGPVIMRASDTAYSLRFPAGTVFPKGTTSAPGKLPDWVVPGVPTTAEIIVPPNNGNIKFPAAASLPAIPDTRLQQIAINASPSDTPATTGGLAPDIAIGSGAVADGKYIPRIMPIDPITLKPKDDSDAKEKAFVPLAALAVGDRASSTGPAAVALGYYAKSSGGWTTAIGGSSSATGNYATAIGTTSSASGRQSTAIGFGAQATQENAIAFGLNATAFGNRALAIGSGAEATNFASSFGRAAKAHGESSLSLGANSTATEKDSVALGSNAVTEAAHIVGSKVTLNGRDYGIAAGANSVVSLGNNDADPAKRVKRQIVNVAAGEVSAASTDVVNGSQLNAAYEGIKMLGDGAIQYSVTKDTTGKEIVDYSKVQLRGISGTKIENVAAGQLNSTSTDAVNGSQLNTTNEKINALDVVAGTRLVAAENNLAAVKTTAEAAKTGADAATTKLAGLSDATVQKSIDASATKLGETVGQSVKTVEGNLAAVKTTAEAAKTGADAAATKLAGLSDATVQKSIDASATKLGETIGQSVKTVEGNLAAVKTTAEAAKTGADAATTKLAGLSDDTVQASINTATAKIGQAATALGESVAVALGEGAKLDDKGNIVLPDFGLTSLGKDASGNAVAQPSTMLGGLKALDGVVASQDTRLVTAEGTLKTQGEALAGQGSRLDTAETNIGALQQDALVYNKTLGTYSAAHGTDKTSRISNVAAGTATNDAVNLGQLETASSKLDEAVKTVAQNIAALASGASGLVTADADGKVLAIGSGSGATTVDLGHQVAKLDDTGKAVVDADGKPVMETKDRILTGIADGVARNDAVNKGQLDVVDKRSVKYVWKDKNQNGTLDDGEIETAALMLEENLDKSGKSVGTRLGNVANGLIDATSLEAVNGGQVHAAVNSVAQSLGGNATVVNGMLAAPSYSLSSIALDGGLSEKSFNNVGDALGQLSKNDQLFNSRFGQLKTEIVNLAGGVSGVIKDDKAGGVIAIGSASDADKVDFSHQVTKLDDTGKAVVDADGKPVMETKDRVLTGIADGAINATSSEAVTGKQLHRLDKRAVKYGWKDKNGNGILDDDEVQTDIVEFGQQSITGQLSGMTTLKNIAGGFIAENSHEAINGGQLYNTATSIADTIGAGARVVDGVVTGPRFVVSDFHSQWNEYISSSGNDTNKKYIGFGYKDRVVGSFGEVIENFNKNSATFDLRIQANHERLNTLYDTALRLNPSQTAYDASPEKYNAEAHYRKLLDDVETQKLSISSGQIGRDGGPRVTQSTGRSGDATILTPDANRASVAAMQTPAPSGLPTVSVAAPQNGTGAPVATGSSETSLPMATNEKKIEALADGLVEQGSKEAVNGGQLHAADAKIGQLSDRALTYVTVNGAKTNAVKLQGGDPTMPVVISNLSAGTDDLDAVNVKQLKSHTEAVAANGQQAAKNYSDEVGEKSVTKSNNYSADIAAKGVQAAKVYSDGNKREAIAAAKTYTDDTKQKAIDAANAYTDARIDGVEGAPGIKQQIAGVEANMAKGFNQLSSDISSVRQEARQAAAIGLAASSLRFDNTPGKISVAMGGGLWRDQSAFAVGAGYTSETGKVRANITGVKSGDQIGVGAGLSFTLN